MFELLQSFTIMYILHALLFSLFPATIYTIFIFMLWFIIYYLITCINSFTDNGYNSHTAKILIGAHQHSKAVQCMDTRQPTQKTI